MIQPTSMSDARIALFAILLLLAAYEVLARISGGWTVSHLFWAAIEQHPWVRWVLGAFLFGLWGHLAFRWGGGALP